MRKLPTESLITSLFILSMFFLLTGKAVAVPKGQPFIELQSEIVEVTETVEDITGTLDDMQPYLDALVARVESLEGRVTANEDAIDDLEAQNLIYDQQIMDLVTLASQNNIDIADAVARIAFLEVDMELLKVDAATNADAILVLEAEMATLMDFITANTDGLLTLQTLANNNYAAIAAMQEEMALIQEDLLRKQDILSGNCPEGSALTSIDLDGGITCAVIGVGGSGFTKFIVTKMVTVEPRHTEHYTCGGLFTCSRIVDGYGVAIATCPVGSLLSGGGAVNPHSLIITLNSSSPAGYVGNSWVVTARSDRSYPTSITSEAQCLKFE